MAPEPKPELSRGDAGQRERHARNANLRTGAILGSIALVFFGGIVAAQYTGAPTVSIGVLGFAIIGFLAVAICRSARK